MEKRIIRHFGHIAFVVYLCLFVLMPVTHCHADEVLSENTACGTGCGPDHLPFYSVDTCCELHASGHTDSDEHHIHFLIDDQGRAARHNPADKSPALQTLAAIDDTHLSPSMQSGIGVVVLSADFYQEALRPFSSGLSPPLS